MIKLPTCFEDLEWAETTKPTSAHFMAIILAIRERMFAGSSNIPHIDTAVWGIPVLEYNSISIAAINDFLSEIKNRLEILKDIVDEVTDFSQDFDRTDYRLLCFSNQSFWMPHDFVYPYVDGHSQALEGYVDYLWEKHHCLVANLDEFLPCHRLSTIDLKAVMIALIQYKNTIGRLTKVYSKVYATDVDRPQYGIDWVGDSEEDEPTWEEAQEIRDRANSSAVEAFWRYDAASDSYRRELLELNCNDGGIPYSFNMPGIVNVHCTSTRTKDGEQDDSWYYDFGTGLKLGWNNLGTHQLGDIIPVLPEEGWGAKKLPIAPTVRGSKGEYICSWAIDSVMIDFSESLKFKVLN